MRMEVTSRSSIPQHSWQAHLVESMTDMQRRLLLIWSRMQIEIVLFGCNVRQRQAAGSQTVAPSSVNGDCIQRCNHFD